MVNIACAFRLSCSDVTEWMYTWPETLWYRASVWCFQWSHTDSGCSHRWGRCTCRVRLVWTNLLHVIITNWMKKHNCLNFHTTHFLSDDVACTWFCMPQDPSSRPPWPSSSWVWPLPLQTVPSSSSQTAPETLQWDGPAMVMEERYGPLVPPPSGGTHTHDPWGVTKEESDHLLRACAHLPTGTLGSTTHLRMRFTARS